MKIGKDRPGPAKRVASMSRTVYIPNKKDDTLSLSDQKVSFLIVSESMQKPKALKTNLAKKPDAAARPIERFQEEVFGGANAELKYARLIGESAESVDTRNSQGSVEAPDTMLRHARGTGAALKNPLKAHGGELSVHCQDGLNTDAQVQQTKEDPAASTG